jgi:hypothetical protein
VTSATAVSRHVQRAKARHDLVSWLGACNIGAGAKFANRLNARVTIIARSSCAKVLRGPFEDVRKVDLGGSTATDTPPPLGHGGPIRPFWK